MLLTYVCRWVLQSNNLTTASVKRGDGELRTLQVRHINPYGELLTENFYLPALP